MMSVQLSLPAKWAGNFLSRRDPRTRLATQRLGRLAARMRNLKGRFLHSINDLPEVRRCFERLHLEEIETVYTIASKAGATPTVPELLISDRPIDAVQRSLLGP